MFTPDFFPWRNRFAVPRRLLQNMRGQALHHLEQLFDKFLTPGLLAQSDEGKNSRERVFTLRRTFFGFLFQVLHPGCSCRTVVLQFQALLALLGEPPIDGATSGYCQARKRLPLEMLARLRRRVAEHADTLLPASRQSWFGLMPKVIDGTTVSMPDTPENQQAYPQSRSQQPGCGFPLLKLVGIFSLTSGALLDYARGNKHQHELSLLRKLLEQFQRGDLALGDRGFCCYVLISLLLGRGVHSVFRWHQARPEDLRKGRRLGRNDRLFVWSKPRQKPRYLPKMLWKRIPKELAVRVLRFQLQVRGFRCASVTLVTTLTDPKAYPALELARLYARRWRIEVWFRHIKTTMGMDVLRCKTPEMVHKELEMFFIAYNLIRTLGTEAASIYDVPVERISFKGTVDAVAQYSFAIVQTTSRQRQTEVIGDLLRTIASNLVPERSGRREPRAVKRRPKPFPRLNKPRDHFRDTPHKNRYRKGDSGNTGKTRG